MLVTSLLPLLVRYSLGLDMVAGPDETVTLTIIPRKAGPKSAALDGSETRPISITASAEEIDAELARGANGALGQLIAMSLAFAYLGCLVMLRRRTVPPMAPRFLRSGT